MAAPRGIPLGLGLGAILLLGGCNLFQPRTPEPPSKGDVVINYSTPVLTLETLARAIEAKAAGNSSLAYIGGFADSINAGDAQNFIAFFDPEVVKGWQSVPGNTLPREWGWELEKEFFNKILPVLSGDLFSFEWLEDEQNPNDEDPVPNVIKVLHRRYQLTATPEAGGNVVTLAIGYADLTFINSKNRWVIARWQDRVDPTVGPNPSSGNQSFSALRLGQI